MRALPLVAIFALAAGCGRGPRNADQQWSEEQPDETPHHIRDTEVLNPVPIDKAAGGPAEMKGGFVGVRHDLMLSSESPKQARCSCLAVEVGQPRDPMFFWQGDRPRIGADSTVVALGAQGIPCPGGDPVENRRRPSISAVDIEGNDVILEVEDLPLGRPLASGAIVPRPGPGGSIYVRPRDARTLYARGAGGGRCKVR